MKKELKGLFEQWESIRNCSTCFVKELKEDDLDKKLPRKGLDTMRKHFEEMFEVQKDFVDALKSSIMDFNSPSDTEYEGTMAKEDILKNMELVDGKLAQNLEEIKEDAKIVWFSEKQTVEYHLASMIAHESMHIGQLIAYCYALDIEIPEYIIENWALSGR